MSKISYEFFDGACEISDAELGGEGLTLCFPEGTEGFVGISGRKHKLYNSEVSLPLSDIENGRHSPTLTVPGAQILLPDIEKRDRLITLPEKTDSVRRLSLRIARLSCRVCELEKQLANLESYVRGTTCF